MVTTSHKLQRISQRKRISSSQISSFQGQNEQYVYLWNSFPNEYESLELRSQSLINAKGAKLALILNLRLPLEKGDTDIDTV